MAKARTILTWLAVVLLVGYAANTSHELWQHGGAGARFQAVDYAFQAEEIFGPLRESDELPDRVQWVSQGLGPREGIWRFGVQYTLAPTLLDQHQTHPVVLTTFDDPRALRPWLISQDFRSVTVLAPGIALAQRQPPHASPRPPTESSP